MHFYWNNNACRILNVFISFVNTFRKFNMHLHKPFIKATFGIPVFNSICLHMNPLFNFLLTLNKLVVSYCSPSAEPSLNSKSSPLLSLTISYRCLRRRAYSNRFEIFEIWRLLFWTAIRSWLIWILRKMLALCKIRARLLHFGRLLLLFNTTSSYSLSLLFLLCLILLFYCKVDTIISRQ